MAEIFAEMTFIFGDVHCDPHQVCADRWAVRGTCHLAMMNDSALRPPLA